MQPSHTRTRTDTMCMSARRKHPPTSLWDSSSFFLCQHKQSAGCLPLTPRHSHSPQNGAPLFTFATFTEKREPPGTWREKASINLWPPMDASWSPRHSGTPNPPPPVFTEQQQGVVVICCNLKFSPFMLTDERQFLEKSCLFSR